MSHYSGNSRGHSRSRGFDNDTRDRRRSSRKHQRKEVERILRERDKGKQLSQTAQIHSQAFTDSADADMWPWIRGHHPGLLIPQPEMHYLNDMVKGLQAKFAPLKQFTAKRAAEDVFRKFLMCTLRDISAYTSSHASKGGCNKKAIDAILGVADNNILSDLSMGATVIGNQSIQTPFEPLSALNAAGLDCSFNPPQHRLPAMVGLPDRPNPGKLRSRVIALKFLQM